MDILLNGDASVDVSDGSGQNVVHLAAAVNVPSQILIPMVKKCNIDKLSVAAIHDLVGILILMFLFVTGSTIGMFL